MSELTLSTLNARYIHASLGLRYLMANLGELQPHARIMEFTIHDRPIDIVEALLKDNPRIIGLGVYIWNVAETTQVVALLKQVRPDVVVVLGGPEVSYEQEQQEIVQLADYVFSGPADTNFGKLCQQLLNNSPPPMKFFPADNTPITELQLPYDFYTEQDIKNRVLYVEASRGCPFKCEFCISALDKTAYPFELDTFLEEMQKLYDRGARQFKFVDRTFNLKIDTSIRIMEFFLERLDEKLFLHFELIPDHLPERLKDVIARFPEGSLQFEIGVQTFNPEVQQNISRKQDDQKTSDNIHWLRNQSHAHLHTDLIIGLPGEDMASFATGFDKLLALSPHEIQVGILKRLRGTPIIRHTKSHALRFNPYPPYNILSTDKIDFVTLQRLSRFARYWDMIANSGRFRYTLPLLLGASPFQNFMTISDWLFATTKQTHKIALSRLFELLYRGMQSELNIDALSLQTTMQQDFAASGIKGHREFLATSNTSATDKIKKVHIPSRQAKHILAKQTK